jgi:hypothetical protein
VNFHGTETMAALCWCQAEIVPATRQQVLDGDVYCDRCKPSVCSLCAGEHDPVDCALSVGYRRRPRRDRGVAKPSRQRPVHAALLGLPLIGDWNGWMTVALVALVVAYLVQQLCHLTDGELSSEEPQPGDMSTLAGWDEYVMGGRLERELGQNDGPVEP